MNTKLVNQVRSTLSDRSHPYMQGAWAPIYEEYNATDMEVIGRIPKDIDGVYARNTENQVHEPLSRFHPFDADGMIHMISIADGKAEYRNRFVRTKGFLAEQEAGKSLWAHYIDNPKKSLRPGWGAYEWVKDSSSTDVVAHAGRLLSTSYQCGDGYQLDPYTLEQFGTVGWAPVDGIAAHARVDVHTGELMFFNYSKHAPYLHYGVVGPDNRLKHYVPAPLPGPRLPHDIAFTKNYTILNDLPLFWMPELLEKGIYRPNFFPDIPSRFAVIPRYGKSEDIQWFEADPTFVLHWINAYEDGDWIVLDGHFQDSPLARPRADSPEGLERFMAFLSMDLLETRLHRWRFNLKTGETREERLGDQPLEFTIINQQYAGRPYRYSYSPTNKPGWWLFDGITKNDMLAGTSTHYAYADDFYGSEPGFAPRVNAQDEDDGYLVTFVSDVNANRSECQIIDAQELAAGPVCRIILPHRICNGTHAIWAQGDELRNPPAWSGPKA